jgi:heptosyltransferase-2
MAEPAIRAIAERFPDARLDVQIARPLIPLARTWRFVERVLPVHAGSRAVENLDILSTPLRLRRRRFDLAIVFPHAWTAAHQIARARVPRRVGYAREGRGPLLTDPIPPPEAPRLHMIVYYWKIAETMGCGEVPVRARLDAAAPTEVPRILAQHSRTAPRIEPTDEMRDAADRLFRRAGIGEGPLAVVVPGSAEERVKRWPAERFGALCGALTRELQHPCAILGSRGERELGATVREQAGTGHHVVDLTGRTDVGTLIGVLARATLFVGNDSGPAHLAAALGRPGVTLFGPTSEGHSGPVGPRMRTLHRPLTCSPCFERQCPLSHHDCLRGLPVDDVVAAALRALAGAAP